MMKKILIVALAIAGISSTTLPAQASRGESVMNGVNLDNVTAREI